MKVPFAIGGSGSAYITGFFDKYWVDDMSQAECVDFCKRAVAHAFARDGSSGGSVRLVAVTEKGPQSEYVDNSSTMRPYGEQHLQGFSGFTSQVVPT
eukprot:jgi/Ulvmu1/12143/UM085_0007.1